MDIKKKIDELVDKIKPDPKLLAQFKSNPIGAVEGLIGVNLPDEQLKPLIAGIQAKLEDKGGVLGKIGKLF